MEWASNGWTTHTDITIYLTPSFGQTRQSSQLQWRISCIVCLPLLKHTLALLPIRLCPKITTGTWSIASTICAKPLCVRPTWPLKDWRPHSQITMEDPTAGIPSTVSSNETWYKKRRKVAEPLNSLQRLQPGHQLPGKRQSLWRPTNLLKLVYEHTAKLDSATWNILLILFDGIMRSGK